ncbi:MAG: hypothetical protein ACTHJ2_09590 [Candidatus Nitrosocosmicus sp.]
MTAVIRHSDFTNGTGAVVVAGGAPVEIEANNSIHSRSVTLTNSDVGNAAGQTQHANGMIIAELEGSDFKRVICLEVFRLSNNFYYKFDYRIDATANYGTRIINANGKSTLMFRDGAAGNGLLLAGDIVTVTFEAGNS